MWYMHIPAFYESLILNCSWGIHLRIFNMQSVDAPAPVPRTVTVFRLLNILNIERCLVTNEFCIVSNNNLVILSIETVLNAE